MQATVIFNQKNKMNENNGFSMRFWMDLSTLDKSANVSFTIVIN